MKHKMAQGDYGFSPTLGIIILFAAGLGLLITSAMTSFILFWPQLRMTFCFMVIAVIELLRLL